MINSIQYNDPEYRWYHKEEMAKIMPYASERKRLGIVVLDYQKMREENEDTIKEKTNHYIDWGMFKFLVESVPVTVDKTLKKKNLHPQDRLHFEVRDKGRCLVCTSSYHYGSCNPYTYKKVDYELSHLHHVIPNGEISDTNIVTLCTHCHQMVHQALCVTGRWRYHRPL